MKAKLLQQTDPIGGRPRRSQLLRLCALTLVVCFTWPGCCTLDKALDGLTHSHANRCTCTSANACCPARLEVAPPEGYLDHGPVMEGTYMAPVTGKSALDTVIELREEVDQLQTENDQVRKELVAAADTIEQQQVAIQAAGKELQAAMADYQTIREQMARWQRQLSDVDDEFRDVQAEQDRAFEELEERLEGILTQYDGGGRQAAVTLQAPRNRVASGLNGEDAR